MSNSSLFSLIVPVFNRQIELKNCIESLLNQSYTNYEIIVIDDYSDVDIKSLVEAFNDNRLKYYRNIRNGGPYNARTLGWKVCNGDYVINFDSDWKAFPWMLERANYHFMLRKDADAVSGMFLRDIDSKMFVRVSNGSRLVSPDDAAVLPSIPDCIGAVKKEIIQEWLQKNHDYFALESHSWLTFSLKHNQLYVDEPWALYYVNSINSVTSMHTGKSEKLVNDCILFLDDHDSILRTILRPDIDKMLANVCVALIRNAHWNGVKRCIQYMEIRKMNAKEIIVKNLAVRFLRKIKKYFYSKSKEKKAIWI
jgi:glycosyltransferase involved in cell wall biosynthesis